MSWFIACHGRQPSAAGLVTAPTCTISGKMKVYFYVREGEQLSMTGGWALWGCLMYGERGGVAAAKREAIYVKDRNQSCFDYEFGMNAGETWDDTEPGHHAIDTVGIFAVGNYTPPAVAPALVGPAIPTFPQFVKLSAILRAAAAAQVDEVHVGACRERSTGGAVLTPRWLS